MSVASSIVGALAALGAATDSELAQHTGFPAPSIRRTRLHLLAAGTVVRVDNGRYALRAWWEKPHVYTGKQVL